MTRQELLAKRQELRCAILELLPNKVRDIVAEPKVRSLWEIVLPPDRAAELAYRIGTRRIARSAGNDSVQMRLFEPDASETDRAYVDRGTVLKEPALLQSTLAQTQRLVVSTIRRAPLDDVTKLELVDGINDVFNRARKTA